MNECIHEEKMPIDIPGTDESILICTECGYEVY